jgi:hypothetical protein
MRLPFWLMWEEAREIFGPLVVLCLYVSIVTTRELMPGSPIGRWLKSVTEDEEGQHPGRPSGSGDPDRGPLPG